MTRSHRTTTARLGMLAAIGAAVVITGCTAAPAPTPVPAAPSAAASAVPAAPSAAAALPSAAVDAAAVASKPELVVDAPASPAASDAVAREAGFFSRGTATCIWNGSSDDMKVNVYAATASSDGYGNTNGMVAFPARTWRCFKGDSLTDEGAPRAIVRIPNGNDYTVKARNPGDSDPWISVNFDERPIGSIGGTTSFNFGTYPVTAKRIEDSGSVMEGGWIQFEVYISN